MIPPRLHGLPGGDRDGAAPAAGDAPVAVFVHGMEDDCRGWAALARSLGPGWRTLAMCVPWHAGNDYSWRYGGRPGDWVGAGLSKLDTRPTVLVGHSFGANAVLELLATNPEPPARTAVLTAPFYRPRDAPVTWRAFDRSRLIFQRQISDGLRSRLAARRAALEPDILESMIDQAWERTGPSAFLTVFEQYLASGHLPVETVEIPVLVVGGERDPGLNREHLRALTDRLPLGLFACEPDYDHFCHRRHAHRLGRSIDTFARYGIDAERSAR